MQSQTTSRKRDSLPFTDLGWVQIHDHFVATVGPSSGAGHALSSLVVLADATLPVGSRFPFHPHVDMEIVTVVLEGTLLHTEPGHEEVLPERSVQWISAGEGIIHAEGNGGTGPVHLLQIWIRPDERGGDPHHGVTPIPPLSNVFQRISPAGLRAPAVVEMAHLGAGESTELVIARGRITYLLFVDGSAQIDDVPYQPGDGAIAQPGLLPILATSPVTVVAITVPQPLI